jgi:hypothetical protein
LSYEKSEVRRPKGINKDLSPYELPPEMWSDGSNITFRRNRVAKALGYGSVWELTPAQVTVQPLHILYFTDNIDAYWAYANETAIWKTAGDGASTLDISRTVNGSDPLAYSASRDASWTSINFNNIALFNNRNDIPQVLEPISKLTMENLPWWNPSDKDDADYTYMGRWGEGARCEVIRGFKNYLVAMDCYQASGTREPATVRWSSPAEGGDVPPSWDEMKAGEQAGDYWISDTNGRVVDGLTLGDYFVIYKTDAVWLMDFIGGDFTMRFRKLFGDEAGMLAKECVAEFDGKHFVLSPTGAYVHNAASKEDIMEQWVRDEFFDNVATERLLETKVVADHTNREIWIYYVTQSEYLNNTNAWPNRALIWNWDTSMWTIKDLTGLSHIAEGVVESTAVGVDDWDSDSQVWNLDDTVWDGSIAFNPADKSLLLADYDNSQFYANEFGKESAGVLFTGFVKRIGVDMEDDHTFKEVSRITPHILGSNPVHVAVFVEDTQTGSGGTYHGLGDFYPQFDNYVDCHAVGRYVGVQFTGSELWTLTGYSVWWKPLGNF